MAFNLLALRHYGAGDHNEITSMTAGIKEESVKQKLTSFKVMTSPDEVVNNPSSIS